MDSLGGVPKTQNDNITASKNWLHFTLKRKKADGNAMRGTYNNLGFCRVRCLLARSSKGAEWENPLLYVSLTCNKSPSS